MLGRVRSPWQTTVSPHGLLPAPGELGFEAGQQLRGRGVLLFLGQEVGLDGVAGDDVAGGGDHVVQVPAVRAVGGGERVEGAYGLRDAAPAGPQVAGRQLVGGDARDGGGDQAGAGAVGVPVEDAGPRHALVGQPGDAVALLGECGGAAWGPSRVRAWRSGCRPRCGRRRPRTRRW